MSWARKWAHETGEGGKGNKKGGKASRGAFRSLPDKVRRMGRPGKKKK